MKVTITHWQRNRDDLKCPTQQCHLLDTCGTKPNSHLWNCLQQVQKFVLNTNVLRDTVKHSFTLSFNALAFVLVRNQCSVLYSVKCTLRQADGAMLSAGRAGTSSRVSGRVNVSEFFPVYVWPLIWVGYQWWAAMVKYGQVSSTVVPLEYRHN